MRRRYRTGMMNETILHLEDPAINFLHQIGSRMAAADPLHEALGRIVDFTASVVNCDSCFVYVLSRRNSCCAPQRIRIRKSSTG